MRRGLIDLTGHRFGRLTVIKRAPNINGNTRWECLCDCGNQKIAQSAHLRNSLIFSCGCLRKEAGFLMCRSRRLKHSENDPEIILHTQHPLYRVWCSMIRRCETSSTHNFHRYGGRGIKVCKRWRESFPNFALDVGPKPTKEHSLDRINNDEGYEPSNIRWATRSEQAKNRSRHGFNPV